MRANCLLSWCAAYLLGCANSGASHTSSKSDGGWLITSDAAVVGCEESEASALGAAGKSECTPSKQRDFSSEVQPLFASCSGEICHSFTAQQLALEVGQASAQCCPKRSLIIPGAPERSYLLSKLRGEQLCAGARMPLDQAPLSEPEIQAISDWICEGAPTAR